MMTTITETPHLLPTCETPEGTKQVVTRQTPDWHYRFLQLLPAIRRHACVCFRLADPTAREEAIQEVIANAFVAYTRLVERDKEDMAYATPLANYAVAQVRAGRRVGNRRNVRDVTSEYCRTRKGVRLEPLEEQASDGWREIAVESRLATPADVAATRIDFENWLAALTPRNRQLAEALASGETTSSAARAFGVSPGRISQLRGELRSAWHFFQGEPLPNLA